MIRLDRPGPGTPVEQYADTVLTRAREENEPVTGTFNDTPVVAFPDDDSAEMVRMRWHYERLLIQIALGKIDAGRAADPIWRELRGRELKGNHGRPRFDKAES